MVFLVGIDVFGVVQERDVFLGIGAFVLFILVFLILVLFVLSILVLFVLVFIFKHFVAAENIGTLVKNFRFAQNVGMVICVELIGPKMLCIQIRFIIWLGLGGAGWRKMVSL